MKVVAFNGSPHKEGNTYQALKMVLEELEKEGIETEIVNVGNKKVAGCVACLKCHKSKDQRCAQTKDKVNDWIQKMNSADGIILGSPVHFASASATMTAFLDRAFYVAGANGGLFRHKVGTAVVAVRRAGATVTLDQLHRYLLYAEMFLPSSNYWNIIHGALEGEALQDAEGCQTMRVLGRNMAFLMKSLEHSHLDCQRPEQERKVFTNFIR
ncbi:MAG: flavodoxin family protein [Syntrophomonas sp.]|nr:flavodoxin family protein [Syntrophomonas sp.]